MTEQTQQSDEQLLTSHNYDGIQEYDNPMPAWWTWIFLATVVWAGVYFVGINLDFLPDYEAQLAAQNDEFAAVESALAAATPQVTPELLAEAAKDDARVKQGAAVYAMNCAACHGQKGEGLIGPNLTDTAWLYGPKMTDFHEVIAKGTSKGMPAWSQILVHDDLVAVVAFVNSLKGTNPPNGKAPEGTDYVQAAELGKNIDG